MHTIYTKIWSHSLKAQTVIHFMHLQL